MSDPVSTRRLPAACTLFERLLALRKRLGTPFRSRRVARGPARLSLEAMEERLVPANEVIISSAVQGSENNWSSGHVYVQRSGDLSQPLIVPFALSGSAVAQTDFTADVAQ